MKKIHSILYDSDFDRFRALQEHLDSLEKQQKKIQNLIQTVKATMASMKGEIRMNDKEKFDAFKQTMIEEYEMTYAEEAREKYGEEEVDSYIQKISDMSWERYQYFDEIGRKILKDLKEAVKAEANPESEMGRQIVLLHRNWLECDWKEYTKQTHKAIVKLYLEDQRFRNYYDKEQQGCTKFLSEAVNYWLDKEEK